MPIIYRLVKTGIHDKPDFRRTASREIIAPAVDRSTQRLLIQTQQNFPVGATSVGRNSIVMTNHIVGTDPIQFIGRVESQIPYVEFVEKGTRPHRPPIAPLRRWALKILGDADAAWGVAKKIARRGTRAQRPFARAVDQMEPTIRNIVVRAVRKWERALSD